MFWERIRLRLKNLYLASRIMLFEVREGQVKKVSGDLPSLLNPSAITRPFGFLLRSSRRLAILTGLPT